MTLTPAIKGQLTKAVTCRIPNVIDARERKYAEDRHYSTLKTRVRAIFARHMPAQQAKHATRAYLASLAR